MFGWINDCTECLVVSKFGVDTWHKIKEKAGCDVQDGRSSKRVVGHSQLFVNLTNILLYSILLQEGSFATNIIPTQIQSI